MELPSASVLRYETGRGRDGRRQLAGGRADGHAVGRVARPRRGLGRGPRLPQRSARAHRRLRRRAGSARRAPARAGLPLLGGCPALGRRPPVGRAGGVDDTESESLVAGAEGRLCDFADLVAQAVSNADAYDKLAGSRARIVEAGDAERRRLERNLHDGAQQRLVSLALQLRLVEASFESNPARARQDLAEAREQLRTRSTSCASSPAGSTPPSSPTAAWPPRSRPSPPRAAARRDRRRARRAPARAGRSRRLLPHRRGDHQRRQARSRIARRRQRAPRRRPRPRPGRRRRRRRGRPDAGSGLHGLTDRVEALHGHLRVDSPPGGGTRLEARIPVG